MVVLLSMAVLAGVLAGCGDKNKLADVFDEDGVKQQAMDDITLGESDDYEGWKARFVPEIQEKLTEDIYNSYLEGLKEKGAFTEFGKAAILGQEQDGKDYAVVVFLVKHEKGEMKYTISYNEEMQLINYLVS